MKAGKWVDSRECLTPSSGKSLLASPRRDLGEWTECPPYREGAEPGRSTNVVVKTGELHPQSTGPQCPRRLAAEAWFPQPTIGPRICEAHHQPLPTYEAGADQQPLKWAN